MTTFKPKWGTRKVLEFTINKSESLDSTPDSLDTSKPSTPTFAYTVASGDLPTATFEPYSAVKQFSVGLAGQNTNASTQTVNYSVDLNSSEILTGSTSVSTNYYWMLWVHIPDVSISDVINVYVWAASTDVKYDYQNRALYYQKIIPSDNAIIRIEEMEESDAPSMSLGSPVGGGTAQYMYHRDIISGYNIIELVTDGMILQPSSTYGLSRNFYAYSSNYGSIANRSARPWSTHNRTITKVIYRELIQT